MVNEYKETYEERKEKVLSLLDKTYEHYIKFNDADKAQTFKSLYTNVKGGNFSIVVVGEFSAGKSTFLNALMGEKYLPSFSTETTATVNFLKHIDLSESGDSISVVFKDGIVEKHNEATLENIERFVSTRSSVKVAKEIEYVELFLDSDYLRDGVTLVDSPGLNGIMEGHEEITQRQIEKSHACIFMFSADAPGKRTDYEFLRQLKSKVNTIIFVLNRIDEIKDTEKLTVEDIIGVLKNNYKAYFPGDPVPEIWPIAAYPALVARNSFPLDYERKINHTDEDKEHYLEISRISEFENRLWRFLTQGEKTKQELLAPVDRVKKILMNRKQDLDKRIEDLKNVNNADKINNEINELENEVKKLESSLQDKYIEISKEVDSIVKELKENLKSNTIEIRDKYYQQVEEWTDLDNVTSEIEKFNDKVKKEYITMIKNIHEEFIDTFCEIIKIKYATCFLEVEEKLNKIDNTLNIEFSSSLNLDDFDLNFGIEDYSKKIIEIESEIDNLNEKIDEVGSSKIKAQILINQKEAKEEDLKSIKKRLDSFEAILGPRPSAKKTMHTEMEKEWRSGVIGAVATILIGKRLVPKEVVGFDKSDQVNYDEQKIKIEDKFTAHENQLKEDLKNLKDPELHPGEYEALESKLARIKSQKELKLDEFRNTFKEKFQKKYGAALRNIKHEIEDFIDDLEKEVEKILFKKIRDQKKQMSEIAVDIINKNINEDIARKESDLKIRKKQLESSIEEKEVFINAYVEEKVSAENLLTEAAEMFTEIDMIKTDFIQMND